VAHGDVTCAGDQPGLIMGAPCGILFGSILLHVAAIMTRGEQWLDSLINRVWSWKIQRKQTIRICKQKQLNMDENCKKIIKNKPYFIITKQSKILIV
jgi:hypothetical protein